MKSVSQEVVNVKRVKEVLQKADAMMKAVTQSHVDQQLGHNYSPTSEESKRWIQTVEDMHNAAKYLAKDKLEEMGALDQVEDSPSKAMVKTQIKKSKRTLQGIILRAVTNMNRLVTKVMTQAQYFETGPLVKKLLTPVRVEYCDIVSQLEFAILSEEGATLLGLTQSEQVTEPGAEGSPAETQTGQGDNAARGPSVRNTWRLDPQSTPKFHDSEIPYPVFGWMTKDKVGQGTLQVNLQANRKEVGRANLKSQLSLAGVEGWASELGSGEKQACFRTERMGRKFEDCPPKTEHQDGPNNGLCHNEYVADVNTLKVFSVCHSNKEHVGGGLGTRLEGVSSR